MCKSPTMNKPPDLRHPWSRRYVLPSQKWRGVPLQTEARFSENLNFSREFISNYIVSFPRNQALSHCACPKIFLYVGLLNFLYVGLLDSSLLRALLNFKPLQQLNHASFPRKQTSCVFQATSHTFIQLHMLSDMCSTNHNETSLLWFSILSSDFPQGNVKLVLEVFFSICINKSKVRMAFVCYKGLANIAIVNTPCFIPTIITAVTRAVQGPYVLMTEANIQSLPLNNVIYWQE